MRIRVIAARLVREADGIARAAEVRVADRDHADDAVLARVASADAERSRALLRDVELHDDGIRVDTRVHLDVDILEEAEVVDALHAAARELRVERLTRLLAHLAQDDALLRLRIALDLVALEDALVDLEGQDAILVDVHVRDLCEDVAVAAVLFLDGHDVLVELAAVEDLARLHGDEPLERLRALDRVAAEANALEDRVLQHVVRDDDTFRHLLKARIDIVEVARVVDLVAVGLEALDREHVAGLHRDGGLRRALRQGGSAVEHGLDDSLTFVLLHAVRDSRLLRARLAPVQRALVHCARRNGIRLRRSRSFGCGLCLRRSSCLSCFRRCRCNGGRILRSRLSRCRGLCARSWGLGCPRCTRHSRAAKGNCHSVSEGSVVLFLQRSNLLYNTFLIGRE